MSCGIPERLLSDAAAGRYDDKRQVAKPNGADAPDQEIDTPLYSVDSMVRRAHALQQTLSAKRRGER